MINLRDYLTKNIDRYKNDAFYNESFCHIIDDYLGMMGEFSDDDISFLKENDYLPEDFID